jgi:hypothetical protein
MTKLLKHNDYFSDSMDAGGCARRVMRIYNLSLPETNLTFKWCTLLTQTRKWRPSIGGITKSTFSARKESVLAYAI